MSKRASEFTSSVRSNRSRRVTRSIQQDLSCAYCCSSIPLISDHVIVYPCECSVFMECLVTLLAPRNKDVECLACCTSMNGHLFHKARSPRSAIVKYEQPEQQQFVVNEKSWLRQPLKSLMLANKPLIDNPPDGACEMSLLYGVRYIKEANQSKWTLKKSIIPLTRCNSDAPGRAFCQRICQFGAFLCPIATQSSKKPYSQMMALAPEQFIRQKAETLTPLTSILFGLATAKTEIDVPTVIRPISGDPNQTASEKAMARKTQSEFAAIASASDLLLRTTVDHPCEFQLMLNRRLNMVDLRRDDRDLLSIFRIIPSRSYSRADLARKVMEQMSQQIDVGENELHIVLTDNVCFKALANHDPTKIGIKQTTKVIDVVITEAMLKEAGILSDDGTQILLSTEPSNSWEELRKDKQTAKRLTSPTARDIDALTECVAESMQTAINDILSGNLAVGKKRLRSARFIDRQTKGELLSRSGVSVTEMSTDDVEAMISCDYVNETDNSNKAQPVMSMQLINKDLAKTSTIKLLADYVLAVQKRTLNRIEDPAKRKSCLMAKVGSFILCDGQPAAQFQSLLAEDANTDDPQYGGIKCFFGAFHTILKMHNAMGKIFDYIFKVVFAKYRRTLARILYIQFPGDARQIEREFPELLQAMYMSAAKYFYLLNRRAPSVKELHEYMLQRGEKYPVVALLILYARFAEVNKMMKMSERKLPRGNRELYFQTLRIVLSLFTITHKTDYVRLICDFFMVWECASPTMRAVFDNFLFCQVSSTGFPVMSDLFVELQIKRTRYDVGKVDYRGIDIDLEASLYKNSVERPIDGTIIERLRTGGEEDSKNRSQTHIDTTPTSPILKLFEFFFESQFFHPTEPPIVGRNKEDNSPVYAEEDSNVTHDGEHLNRRVLYFPLSGCERAEQYMQLNELDHKRKVGRSEQDVDLKSIPVSGAGLTELRDKEVDRKVSVDSDRLMDIMNKPQLVEEIQETHFTLVIDYDFDDPEPSGLSSKNKNALVNTLIELRRKYFEIDDEAKTHIEEAVKREFDDRYQAELSMTEILSLNIYQLSDDILCRQEYSTPPVVDCNV